MVEACSPLPKVYALTFQYTYNLTSRYIGSASVGARNFHSGAMARRFGDGSPPVGSRGDFLCSTGAGVSDIFGELSSPWPMPGAATGQCLATP